MTKVILVAHGCLAVEMKRSLEMIFGKAEQFFPVIFNEEDGLDRLEEKLKSELDTSTGSTLIMADLYCGTPYNASCSLAMKKPEMDIQVVSGMSLPLVLETAALIDTLPLNEIVCKIQELSKTTVQSFSGRIADEEEEF